MRKQPPAPPLPFEKPISKLEEQLQELESDPNPTASMKDSIRNMRLEITRMKREIFMNLDPWETVQVARHQERPQVLDYIELVLDEFVELHGDRADPHGAGPDRRRKAAVRRPAQRPQPGRTDRAQLRDGSSGRLSEGDVQNGNGGPLRTADRVFHRHAGRLSGNRRRRAGPGLPDRDQPPRDVAAEGCAGILYKDVKHRDKAARALRFTAADLLELGVIDEIIPEPLGGAHRDHRAMATMVKGSLLAAIRELKQIPREELADRRYEKFRRMGQFEELAAGAE